MCKGRNFPPAGPVSIELAAVTRPIALFAQQVSSAMDDTRPNGQALFDARFHGNAMGRARGGYSMMADARGMEFTSGKLEKAENLDSNFFAEDMADETAAAEASAEKNKYGCNTNMVRAQSLESPPYDHHASRWPRQAC